MIPSSLYAAIFGNPTVTKRPAPYFILYQEDEDGNPVALNVHVIPSELYTTLLEPVEIATNFPFPYVTDRQDAVAFDGKSVENVHVDPVSLYAITLTDELLDFIATNLPFPYVTDIQVVSGADEGRVAEVQFIPLLLYAATFASLAIATKIPFP